MSKKTRRYLLYSAFALSSILLLAGTSSASGTVSILPSSGIAAPGEDLTLQIYVEPDEPVAGLQLDLSYDSSLVEVSKIEEGNLFLNSGSSVIFNPGNINSSSGTVSLVYSTIIMGNAVTDEGTFCTVHLRSRTKKGMCQFRLNNVILGDEQGKELPVSTLDSIINIKASEKEISEDGSKNDADPELNVVPRDTGNGTLQETEQDITADRIENKDQSFESTGDNSEVNEINEVAIQEPESNLPDLSLLILAAMAFFSIAYLLDRKK